MRIAEGPQLQSSTGCKFELPLFSSINRLALLRF